MQFPFYLDIHNYNELPMHRSIGCRETRTIQQKRFRRSVSQQDPSVSSDLLNRPISTVDTLGLTPTYCETLANSYNAETATGDAQIDAIGGVLRTNEPKCKSQVRCLADVATICSPGVKGCMSIEGEGWDGSTKKYPEYGTCYANVCENQKDSDVKYTIRHELAHCEQSCISKDYNQATCEELLCMEVRAYDYSKLCNDPTMIGWGDYNTCLKEQAKSSVNGKPVCAGKNLSAILNSSVGSSTFVNHCRGNKGIL